MYQSNRPKSQVPILPARMLTSFVSSFLDRKDVFTKICQQHGSPLWVLESSVLAENARRFSQAFNRFFDRTSFYFAMKTNNRPEVSKILLKNGFGLDVSSGLELSTALALDATDIVFSGPGKTDAELELAVRHSDCTTILVDSLNELTRLDRIVSRSGQNRTVNVGVRLNTNPEGLWRKFGILPEDLPRFWDQVRSAARIRFKGLQFHSSWNMTPDRQAAFISSLGKILAQMPGAFHQSIEFIDIGGGYWPEQGEWLHFAGTPEGQLAKALEADGTLSGAAVDDTHYCVPAAPIEVFAQTLSRAIRDHIFPYVDCRICFEPGRWICHSAMHILFTVVDQKEADLVITDAGTNAIGWERFETDYFPVLNLSQGSLKERSCHILGSLCTPHDVWGYTYFGKNIEAGDLLMIPCQGAYTYSLGQNFIKPLPGFVTI